MLNFIMGDKWEYDLLKRYSFANIYHHQYIYPKNDANICFFIFSRIDVFLIYVLI